jgi:hypothetical protein
MSNNVRIEPHVLGTHSDGEEGKTDVAFQTRDKGCYLCALKKKEIAPTTAGGWGVTYYLQLDWMDDETDGWMEKTSRP